jgi:hypothetical protein
LVEVSSRISESIIENFSLTWQMYKEAINNIPEEEWRTGEIDYLIPARLILHGLEVLDYYSPTTPEIGIQGYQFKLDDQKIPAKQLPSQAQMDQYLEGVREKLETWIKDIDDESFHSSETRFPWTGSTLHGRLLYSLDHSRHHIGELNGELRRRGLPRIKWSYFKK